VCLCACVPVCLSACLPVCLSACVPVCLCACVPVCLCTCLYLSVPCLPVYLCTCVVCECVACAHVCMFACIAGPPSSLLVHGAAAAHPSFRRVPPPRSLTLVVARAPVQLVFPPWNAFVYNSSAARVASHGVHPWWTHVALHLPLMYATAAVVAASSAPVPVTPSNACAADAGAVWRLRATAAATSGSVVLSVVALSTSCHQEYRFLLPLAPMVCLGVPALRMWRGQRPGSGQVRAGQAAPASAPSLAPRLPAGAVVCCVANLLCAAVVAGVHQGGLLPSLLWVRALSRHGSGGGHPDGAVAPFGGSCAAPLCGWQGRAAGRPPPVLYYGTYPPSRAAVFAPAGAAWDAGLCVHDAPHGSDAHLRSMVVSVGAGAAAGPCRCLSGGCMSAVEQAVPGTCPWPQGLDPWSVGDSVWPPTPHPACRWPVVVLAPLCLSSHQLRRAFPQVGGAPVLAEWWPHFCGECPEGAVDTALHPASWLLTATLVWTDVGSSKDV
jgi:hypothetical protein